MPPTIIRVDLPDVFVSGVCDVERMSDGNARFIWYVEHTLDGHIEWHEAIKMVRAIGTMPAVIRAMYPQLIAPLALIDAATGEKLRVH